MPGMVSTVTQSIKYLTVNHVLVILMYIHKSCNNALLFSLIERTQNVKMKTLSLRDINHSRDSTS